VRPAAGAHAAVSTVLGDDERARLGQIEYMPGAVTGIHGGVVAGPQATQEGGK
jgi:hypothetical protein